MKNLITAINLSIIIGITSIFTHSDKALKEQQVVSSPTTTNSVSTNDGNRDVVGNASFRSNFSWRTLSEDESGLNDEEVDFLIEVAEGRVMDLEQGKTAEQRATFKELKQYGALMVKDQSKMLIDLEKIAKRKNFALPRSLGSEKSDALSDLRKVHGEAFDKKFTRMMMIDHKRDIKKLERATQYGDADIKVFATKYLPVVQSHLDQIKALR